MRQKKFYDKTPYVWSTKFTPVQKNFTQPLVVMVETFRMSASIQQYTVYDYVSVYKLPKIIINSP